MYTLRSALIALAAVGILAVVGTLINSRKASAQGGGPMVTIGAPLPLPVRNVSDAMQPFQASNECSEPANTFACGVDIFTVPVGKRAVIEYFSGRANIGAGRVAFVDIATTAAGQSVGHWLPLTAPAALIEEHPAIFWGQQVRLYADSGTSIFVGGGPSGPPTSPYVFFFSISGYLVDLPPTLAVP